jgi:hypothetical protein
VEGSLYVLKRRTNPRFQLMVLNKLNTGVCTRTSGNCTTPKPAVKQLGCVVACFAQSATWKTLKAAFMQRLRPMAPTCNTRKEEAR